MKLLVLAAVVALVYGDVSHLSKDEPPQTKYGIPDSAVSSTNEQVIQSVTPLPTITASPTSPTGIQQLPIHERSSFTSVGSLANAPLQAGVDLSALNGLNLGGRSGGSLAALNGNGFTGGVKYEIDVSSLGIQGSNIPIGDASLESVLKGLQSVPAFQGLAGNLDINSLGGAGINAASLGSSGINAAALGGLGNQEINTVNIGGGIKNQGISEISLGNVNAGLDSTVIENGEFSTIDASGSSEGSLNYQEQQQSGERQVDKHLYFYTAPEEPEPAAPRVILPPPAKKNVKVIFVKAPEFKTPPAPVIAPQALQHSEEKTKVYVLVKKPEAPKPIVIPTPEPTQPSKPEIVFIKYKDQQEAEEAVNHIQTSGSTSGLNVDGANGQSVSGKSEFISTIQQQSSIPNVNLIHERTGFIQSTPKPLIASGGLGLSSLQAQALSNGPLLNSLGGLGGGLGISGLQTETVTGGPLLGLQGGNLGLNGGFNLLGGLNSVSSGDSGLLSNFGSNSLGLISTTASPISSVTYSTTGLPGSLLDSFGSESSTIKSILPAASQKIHSVYGPPKFIKK